MSGTLYVVATPIGHLDDLTPRARQTLADVDLIAAEDTRHTGRLLMHIGCKTRLMSLHDHNEEVAAKRIVGILVAGESVALVSDAGTPLVSDPGYRLVRQAHRAGVRITPVPGPSAVTAALSAAGIATDRFCFEGFLPAKRAARQETLKSLALESRTMVFYESVHRIVDCMDDMKAIFGGERLAFLGRELTKVHEQCVQGSLETIAGRVADNSITHKGEFVLVVAGTSEKKDSSVEVDRLLLLLAEKLPTKETAGIVAEGFGLKKNALYERLLSLRK